MYQKTWPTPVASGPSVGTTPAGSCLGDEVQPLQNAGARKIKVDIVIEDDEDHREAEGRRRAHDLHARQALQVDSERIGDLVLDLLRAAALPVGEDDHLVVAQIGNGVDRSAEHRPQTPARDSNPKHDNDELIFQREFDETINHGKALPQRR